MLFSIYGAWLTVAACSSGGGAKLKDAATQDVFTIDFRFDDLPPGCPPLAANDKGVGARCSAGGNECRSVGAGLICTCDVTLGLTPPPGTPCFCSTAFLADCAAVPAGTCGQNATCCSYMQMASLCVPNICLEQAMCPVFTN